VDSDFPLPARAALAALLIALVLFPIYRKRLKDRERHVSQFTNSLIYLAIIPYALTCLTPNLFVASCGVPHVSDFFWYTVDNVAKGALIDVLQSFPSLRERGKQRLVEALVAQPADEALHESVLLRFAWRDIVPRLEHPTICGRLDLRDPFLATNDLCPHRGDGASHAPSRGWRHLQCWRCSLRPLRAGQAPKDFRRLMHLRQSNR
jgi:hypothetical protein